MDISIRFLNYTVLLQYMISSLYKGSCFLVMIVVTFLLMCNYCTHWHTLKADKGTFEIHIILQSRLDRIWSSVYSWFNSHLSIGKLDLFKVSFLLCDVPCTYTKILKTELHYLDIHFNVGVNPSYVMWHLAVGNSASLGFWT